MLNIDLIEEQAFGEPGPNLVIRGTKKEISRLIMQISKLLVDNTNEKIVQSNKIRMSGLSTLNMNSMENGRTLSKWNEKNQTLEITLSTNHWSAIVDSIRGLGENVGFQYIDLDQCDDLEEDVNIIVESLAE